MNHSKKRIPDSGNPKSNLWIIGEAPGEEEDAKGEVFVGYSGKLLTTILSTYGMDRNDCFITNLFPFHPYQNKFDLIEDTLELKENVTRLKALHLTHQPNVTLALGNNPLKYLVEKIGISNFRGSILEFQSRKLIPTYHPAAVLRDYSIYPIFAHDVRFAIRDSKFSGFDYPIYNYVIDPSDDEVVETLCNAPFISCDIETTRKDKTILCVGFGLGSTGYVFPLKTSNLTKIERILNSKAKKIFHHGAFDINVLNIKGWSVNNYGEDTIKDLLVFAAF